MPQKRTRRQSPTPGGLSVGERLKRAKLTSSKSYSAWGWVGTEVTDASEITLEHRLATCGFSSKTPHPLCPNKYATSRRTAPFKGPKKKARGKHVANEVGDDVIVISDEDIPQCNSKLCKSNPYCLNYLGQEKWEDEDKAREVFLKLAALGTNPIHHSRAPGHPVGLKNLGATCYANAYLQVWYQDLSFRSGVYRCQLPEDSEFKLEESPIFQLQVTFAAMQEGIQSAFNPIKLVESLKLRTSEQQDAQEFSKLFMAHLDTEFQKQPEPDMKTLIPDQFQGKQVYGTICEHCQHRSESVSDFLEIEVNIKNNATLEDRIAALLQSETLSGDNRYHCPQCDNLQDAKRYTELRELPPVLHFSLLRFVYDLTSMERKKSKHTISFPTVIDMEQFLGTTNSRERNGKKMDAKSNSVYELRGVLLHKGASAYHGHYEAQVFDVQNQIWYQFNDETVTRMESSGKKGNANSRDIPKGEPEGKRKPIGHAEKQSEHPRKRRKVDHDSDVEILERSPSTTEGSEKGGPETPVYISSKDAYMLVYSRVSDSDVNTNARINGGAHRANHATSSPPLPPRPPPRVQATVEALNDAHQKACSEFLQREKQTIARFEETRRKVMDIYRTWNLTRYDQESIIASRQGLETWLSRYLTKPKERRTSSPATQEGSSSIKIDMTNDDGDAIDAGGNISMLEIICSHGRLDPERANDMKVITKAAYDCIASDDQCKLLLSSSPSDICAKCVEDAFNERLYQVEHPRLVARFDDMSPVEDDEPGFWISKQWLKDWKLAKPKMHTISQADPAPDAPEYDQVKCEHGGLSANVTARRRISTAAVHLLQELFPSWKPVSTDTELCPVCEALIHTSKEDRREIRKQAEEEKARLKHMHDNALNGNTALLENVPCAIIPAQFVRSWRQWLLRPGEVARPRSIDNSQFICEHGLLCLDPNAGTDMDSSVALIRRSDWDLIEDLYSAGPLIAVENTGAGLKHDLAICGECRLKRKSDYDVTEITVRVLSKSDSILNSHSEESSQQIKYKPPTAIMTYGSRKVGGLRQSNRIRQGKDQGRRCRVTIMKTMSVKDLKLLLQEELDIPIISQRLFYHGAELEDSSATVLSLGILANDQLDLKEQTEDADIYSDSDTEGDKRKKRKEGRGFGGTLLSGITSSPDSQDLAPQSEAIAPSSKSCSACTFDNDTDARVCTMCDTAFPVII